MEQDFPLRELCGSVFNAFLLTVAQDICRADQKCYLFRLNGPAQKTKYYFEKKKK